MYICPSQSANSSHLITPLEKEMATHSSILAWKIPWTEDPGRLQSMGSQRVRHDWASSLNFTGIHTFVLYVCVSISALQVRYLYHFSRFHIYVIIYDICFSDLLHCMTVSRSIYVSENGTILLFFMAESYSIVYMYHIFLIHSSFDGHLACFHVLSAVNIVCSVYLFDLWFFFIISGASLVDKW